MTQIAELQTAGQSIAELERQAKAKALESHREIVNLAADNGGRLTDRKQIMQAADDCRNIGIPISEFDNDVEVILEYRLDDSFAATFDADQADVHQKMVAETTEIKRLADELVKAKNRHARLAQLASSRNAQMQQRRCLMANNPRLFGDPATAPVHFPACRDREPNFVIQNFRAERMTNPNNSPNRAGVNAAPPAGRIELAPGFDPTPNNREGNAQ